MYSMGPKQTILFASSSHPTGKGTRSDTMLLRAAPPTVRLFNCCPDPDLPSLFIYNVNESDGKKGNFFDCENKTYIRGIQELLVLIRLPGKGLGREAVNPIWAGVRRLGVY